MYNLCIGILDSTSEVSTIWHSRLLFILVLHICIKYFYFICFNFYWFEFLKSLCSKTSCYSSSFVSAYVKVKVERYSSHWTPSLSYGVSIAVWDHTVLPVTQHKWTCTALTPARQASTQFTYPGGIEGWVNLGDRLHAEMVYLPQTVTRSSFRAASLSRETNFQVVDHKSDALTIILPCRQVICLLYVSVCVCFRSVQSSVCAVCALHEVAGVSWRCWEIIGDWDGLDSFLTFLTWP